MKTYENVTHGRYTTYAANNSFSYCIFILDFVAGIRPGFFTNMSFTSTWVFITISTTLIIYLERYKNAQKKKEIWVFRLTTRLKKNTDNTKSLRLQKYSPYFRHHPVYIGYVRSPLVNRSTDTYVRQWRKLDHFLYQRFYPKLKCTCVHKTLPHFYGRQFFARIRVTVSLVTTRRHVPTFFPNG